MWIVQNLRSELCPDTSYSDIVKMAQTSDFEEVFDVNDDMFTAPESMIEEVKAATGKADLSIGEMFSVVYHSLADTYKKCVAEVEEIAGKEMKAIHIVGGGCKDDYLCALTAKACGKPVYAGPVEATAIGNLASQMISTGVFGSLSEARTVIFNSFDVKSL
jgi:rhamnulokinase